jgi:histone H3/H4
MSELFTKPAILRLARKAGIKNLSDDCYDPIRTLMSTELEEVMKVAIYLNEIRGTKTISVDDVSDSLRLMGKNLAKSEDLSVASCSKKV